MWSVQMREVLASLRILFIPQYDILEIYGIDPFVRPIKKFIFQTLLLLVVGYF